MPDKYVAKIGELGVTPIASNETIAAGVPTDVLATLACGKLRAQAALKLWRKTYEAHWRRFAVWRFVHGTGAGKRRFSGAASEQCECNDE